MNNDFRFITRIKAGLTQSANALGEITKSFHKRKLDLGMLEELEDLLITFDLGPTVAAKISNRLASKKFDKTIEEKDIRNSLAEVIEEILAPVTKPLTIVPSASPHTILVVGVNGTGKTTTIGKLAKQFRALNLDVVLGAGDTFRAAAIDQIEVWGKRSGSLVVKKDVGSDPAAVAHTSYQRAMDTDADVLLIDTAGRLQNKTELMDELAKVKRVLAKFNAAPPQDVLLVLDATTGQNALSQVAIFNEVCGVTGLVMTKLDGTAKGGILVAVTEKFEIPIHFIGVGESIDDLQRFDSALFSRTLAGLN